MSYVLRRPEPADEWTLERVFRFVFSLGFAREQAAGPKAAVQRQALEDCGAVFPWVVVVATVIWAQVYGMGFIATLAFLEIQAVVIGLVTALFVPQRSLVMLLNIVVNVFLALLTTFLALIAGAFAIGLALLLIVEGA